MGIKSDNKKYYQKHPHFYVMIRRITNNYFLSAKHGEDVFNVVREYEQLLMKFTELQDDPLF